MRYYWHVRYQDSIGLWSDWSDETSFTIVANSLPNQPVNYSPASGATSEVVIPVLKATDFSDPNSSAYVALNDTHAASQWQVRAATGDYTTPAYDSGRVTSGLTVFGIPAGTPLKASTGYYWHVRYQDSYGNWSAYSTETSFTTKSMSAPVAVFTADKTEVVAGESTVTFMDNSTPSGEITGWRWDFGDNATDNWTVRDRPANGKISHLYENGGTYTVKLTVINTAGDNTADLEIVVHARPKAVIAVLTPKKAETGKEITLYEDSDGDITQWVWDFGDGTDLVVWDKAARDAAGGKINHTFKDAGTRVVTLEVVGTIEGKEAKHRSNWEIQVSGPGGFHFGLWMIAVALVAIAVIAGLVYVLRARRAK
jgi:hypothetical protein